MNLPLLRSEPRPAPVALVEPMGGLFADMDGDPDGLRWYQREAVNAILGELEVHRSTLLVMATGGGKTQCFGAIAKHWPGNVLILAHREELIDQARKRIEQMTGEWVEIEKAQFSSTPSTRIVVGSMQTLGKRKRLERLGMERFDLIIIDEAHRGVCPSYKTILAYFGKAKVLGVTATPDRGDNAALKQAFESVAYTFDIEQGIDQGYLVPIRGQRVELAEINLDGITKTAGDLAEGQLDEVMLKAVEGVVKETVRLEPDRQAIVFFPGIKSAELACARFNELRANSAIFIHAKTDEDERKMLIRDFQRGDYQYFCNVGIATEGFDAPNVSLVAIARPTLSRALYTQMVGRGTRPLAGILGDCEGQELHDLRRDIIANSKKPDCMVLDFVGNSGKHSLVGPVDILGGKYTDEEVKRAKKKLEKEPGANPRELLEKARAELRALAKTIKSHVRSEVKAFNPFSILHMSDAPSVEHAAKHGHKPLSKDQRNALLNYGLTEAQLKGMSKFDGDRFISAQRARAKAGLSTYRQQLWMQKYGVNTVNMSKDRANAVLTYMQSKGWGRKGPIDPKAIDKIVNYRREHGGEGDD